MANHIRAGTLVFPDALTALAFKHVENATHGRHPAEATDAQDKRSFQRKLRGRSLCRWVAATAECPVATAI